MTDILSEEDLNKVKKNFITNSIFGQKLINGLSADKKREVNIDYFLSHIKNFNLQKKENWEEKINYKKYIESIPENIQEKLKNETEIIIKNKNCIEPYCKKQIKIITPINIFKKIGFHHKLVKLESSYYDLFGFIYNNDEIVGYVCCGKRSNNVYKNIYVVICKKYQKDFYEKKNKKLSIINEIVEDIGFYEKETYNDYLKHYRNQIYSFVLDILLEHKSIKNIVCIGDEEGGNLLQLFLVDVINNRSEYNVKMADDFSYYLFTHNTAMLSTETFFNDLINYLGGNINSMITCFEGKNDAYDSWDVDEAKKNKYNIILIGKHDI